MNNTLNNLLGITRAIAGASRIKSSRTFTELLSSRITQAATETALASFAEKLMKSMNVDTGFVSREMLAPFLSSCSAPDAKAVQAWVRSNPNTLAIMALTKDDETRIKMVSAITVEESPDLGGVAPPTRDCDIPIMVRCSSPFAHGGDQKSGNATLFRRMDVISTNNAVLRLPYYAGNAFRGQLRDTMADQFLKGIGLTPDMAKPPVKLWFFHALYAGGALQETSKATKSIEKELGANGAIRADGIRKFRDMVPHLSLLGAAMGNRILAGRISVADFRPHCKQWGNGEVDAAQLMEWTFLTRREDHEEHADGEHSGMIATTEALRAGVEMTGGIDLSSKMLNIQASALAHGLSGMQERAWLGANNNRGFGRVELEFGGCFADIDADLYPLYLAENKEAILDYLAEVGAINARDELALN